MYYDFTFESLLKDMLESNNLTIIRTMTTLFFFVWSLDPSA